MKYGHLFSEDVSAFMPSPVRSIFKDYDLSKMISFAGGYPSPDTYPMGRIAEIMTKVAREVGPASLQYGATEGVPSLRKILSRRYDVPYPNIRITTSSQQGIDVCARVLIDPGDVILASEPTFIGALQSFSSYRARVVGIKHENNADSLYRAYIQKISALYQEGCRIKFIYAIPDFRNPSGETIDYQTRKALIRIAGEFNLLIVEDSPYRELRFEGTSYPTLYSMAPDYVVHLGSFSKIFAPGFRLGWMFGPVDVLEQVTACKQSLDLCPPVFDQYVAAEYMGSGLLDANLEKSIALYRRKRDIMLEALSKYMPEGVRWTRPEGGLFIFLELPEKIDVVALYPEALQRNVAYVAGAFFYADRSSLNTVRLNYSFTPAERIEEGIRILAELVASKL